MSAAPLDFDARAEALESLRLTLLKAGPTSGLHRGDAAWADELLASTRDLMREIGERRRARLQRDGQQGQAAQC